MISNNFEADKVSLIVPVYNVEPYIKRCMETLLAQTYDNIEILLIDDGSKDNCPQICDGYAAQYEKVKTYHKSNGGLGSARNYGINKAKGEFICFVDSDDSIDTKYVEKLYFGIKSSNADLCICGYKYTANNRTIVCKNRNATVPANEVIEELCNGKAVLNFAWNKMYKKIVIDKMDMLYSDRHCAEDLYFNVLYYKLIDTVKMIEDPLYTYYVNLTSLSNGRRDAFWQDIITIYDSLRITCREKGIDINITDNALFVFLRNTLSNFLNSKDSNYLSFFSFTKRCLEYKAINDYLGDITKLSKTDRILYNLLLHEHYRMVYSYIVASKVVKKRLFALYGIIRNANS